MGGNRLSLCRVLEALSKAPNTLGKSFAECRTRQKTLNKGVIGKALPSRVSSANVLFAECLTFDPRQRRRHLTYNCFSVMQNKFHVL